jgi:hypothetical protein
MIPGIKTYMLSDTDTGLTWTKFGTSVQRKLQSSDVFYKRLQ